MHDIIDWHNLKSRLGNDDAIREMIAEFMDFDIDYISDLKKALDSRDSDELKRHAQFLKESAETIGAVSLTDSVRKLEMLASENRLENAGSVMNEVQVELNKLQDLLSLSNWFEIVRS
jgi:HPt (histidine-containing phosphotransfer) domain-containing protein